MSKSVIGGTKARVGHIVKLVVLFILLIAYMFPFFMVLILSLIHIYVISSGLFSRLHFLLLFTVFIQIS